MFQSQATPQAAFYLASTATSAVPINNDCVEQGNPLLVRHGHHEDSIPRASLSIPAMGPASGGPGNSDKGDGISSLRSTGNYQYRDFDLGSTACESLPVLPASTVGPGISMTAGPMSLDITVDNDIQAFQTGQFSTAQRHQKLWQEQEKLKSQKQQQLELQRCYSITTVHSQSHVADAAVAPAEPAPAGEKQLQQQLQNQRLQQVQFPLPTESPVPVASPIAPSNTAVPAAPASASISSISTVSADHTPTAAPALVFSHPAAPSTPVSNAALCTISSAVSVAQPHSTVHSIHHINHRPSPHQKQQQQHHQHPNSFVPSPQIQHQFNKDRAQRQQKVSTDQTLSPFNHLPVRSSSQHSKTHNLDVLQSQRQFAQNHAFHISQNTTARHSEPDFSSPHHQLHSPLHQSGFQFRAQGLSATSGSISSSSRAPSVVTTRTLSGFSASDSQASSVSLIAATASVPTAGKLSLDPSIYSVSSKSCFTQSPTISSPHTSGFPFQFQHSTPNIRRAHKESYRQSQSRLNSASRLPKATMNGSGNLNDDEMAAAAAAALANDMATQELLARDYQPELKGPSVGDKVSSYVLTEAYARPDPVYVEKTTALSQTYDRYRAIKGDGNCGWRVIAFSYLEKLVELQNVSLFDHEIVRLQSLTQVIETATGYDASLIADFLDETFDLMKELKDGLSNGVAHAMLLLITAFNDDGRSNAIMYHMRLIASATIRSNPDYEPYTDGSGLPNYCQANIEPHGREIEHIGIDALTKSLLEPAKMVLQVVYLDRSKGSQANIHLFPATASIEQADAAGRSIYLLFRPDHYDILYKPQANISLDISVNRAEIPFRIGADVTDGLSTFANTDFNILNLVPGMSIVPGAPPPILGAPAAASMPFGFLPVDVDMDLAGVSSVSCHNLPSARETPMMAMPAQSRQSAPDLQIRLNHAQSMPSVSMMNQVPSVIPLSESMPTTPSYERFPSIQKSAANEYPLRFSAECLKLDRAFHQPASVSSYKNSHFNKAHFKNPKFTPEQWMPRDDDDDE